MPRTKQSASCLDAAFKVLTLARNAHAEARGAASPNPRIEKYIEASNYYQDAAAKFSECSSTGADTLWDKQIAEAWHYYCLAMHYGDRANGRYFNPLADRRSIIEDTSEAIGYITRAVKTMPWQKVAERDEQVKWKILEHSFTGLMHRAKAQKFQQENKYQEAANEFIIASNNHSKAATLAESLGDQVTYQRTMGRVWSATSEALKCRASISRGSEREKYLAEAEKAARQALQFRPQWSPLQQVFEGIVWERGELERKKAGRIAWIQVLIGFLLGLGADLVLRFFFP